MKVGSFMQEMPIKLSQSMWVFLKDTLHSLNYTSHSSFITQLYLTATTLKCNIIKEGINLKHEETQLILSEKQLISFSLSGTCVPACAPLHVHVVAVHTAILTHCILYLSLAGMPVAIICDLCYLVAEL